MLYLALLAVWWVMLSAWKRQILGLWRFLGRPDADAKPGTKLVTVEQAIVLGLFVLGLLFLGSDS